jgi:hypothetical protein
MAFTQEGLFGKFTGRIGNLVVFQRNGQTVVRTLTTHKMPPATGVKKQAQENFSRVMKLMQALKPFINRGFRDVAGEKSAYHTALSANLKRLREAADPSGLAWLLTSSGIRAGAQQPELQVTTGQATVTWDAPTPGLPCSDDDYVMLVAINGTTLETTTPATTVTRARKQATLNLSSATAGQQVYVFLSFFDPLSGRLNVRNISQSQMLSFG